MATKKGPLSKVEIFYIEGNSEMDIHQLSADLNRNIKTVAAHLETIANAEPPKGESVVGKQFAKRSGTVVMTENASQMTDSKRAYRSSGPVLSSRHQSCVTKITGE